MQPPLLVNVSATCTTIVSVAPHPRRAFLLAPSMWYNLVPARRMQCSFPACWSNPARLLRSFNRFVSSARKPREANSPAPCTANYDKPCPGFVPKCMGGIIHYIFFHVVQRRLLVAPIFFFILDSPDSATILSFSFSLPDVMLLFLLP